MLLLPHHIQTADDVLPKLGKHLISVHADASRVYVKRPEAYKAPNGLSKLITLVSHTSSSI